MIQILPQPFLFMEQKKSRLSGQNTHPKTDLYNVCMCIHKCAEIGTTLGLVAPYGRINKLAGLRTLNTTWQDSEP